MINVKKNIAIIVTELNGDNENRFAGFLSKKLYDLFNVYIFVINLENITFEYSGTIVDIGRSQPFIEYELLINKEKYDIDVAISFDTILNIANIRTQKRDRAIVCDDDIRLHKNLILTTECKFGKNYYSYAGGVVVSDNEVKSYICNKCGVLDDNIAVMQNWNKCSKDFEYDNWIEIIEKAICEKISGVDLLKLDYEVLNKAKHIAIYGAGFVGKTCYLRLRDKYKIDCFITTDKSEEKTLFNIPVFSIGEMTHQDEYTIIIGVSEKFKEEVANELLSRKMKNVVFPYICPMSYDYYLNENSWDLKHELGLTYERTTGKRLDFNFLRTFNEKIQWLKLYNSTPQKSQLADKYLVRNFVSEKVGKKYLVPLLGVWNSFDSIDFNRLPSKFVLKCTHGSGMNEIVFDKWKMDYHAVKKRFDEWLKMDYAYMSYFEMHYSHIVPRIVAESLLETDDGSDLKDYKIFVFHGKAKLIQVDIDRMHEHRRNLYTRDWKYLPYSILYPTAPDVVVNRPQQLEEMLRLAEILGQSFFHVRVDFYICNEKIYFGEMTFSHGSGMEPFNPYKFNEEMGSWLHLPEN